MNSVSPVRVILVGGTSGAGKTTLGTALAVRLGFTSTTVDDLITATHAVTTPESHPGLHVIRMKPTAEYFTNTPVEQMKADADAQHEAIWPVAERLIHKRSRLGPGIVLDGWHFRPHRVAALDLDNVASVWLVADPAVLETRERNNTDWLQGSTDPKRMLENFIARSLWYNELTKVEAEKHGMIVLHQPGTRTVDDLCDEAIERIRQRAAA